MDTSLYKKFNKIQNTHWWFRAKKHIVLYLIDKLHLSLNHGNILDIGCGGGLMLEALQKYGNVTGMDSSKESLLFCREIFTGALEFGGFPDNIPRFERKFNLITMLDVLEHIEKDDETLLKLRNLLDKNGHLVLTVPAHMHLWSNFDVLNHHKRRYELAKLIEKVESAGYEIVKASYYNFFLYPVVYFSRMLSNIFKVNKDELEIPNLFINELLFKIFSFESLMLKLFRLPYGVSIIMILRSKNNL